jgi:glycosyltransferase involved in cell wall biosynthesis
VDCSIVSQELKVGVVHHSLEGKGGSGRFAVNTIEVLNEMGFKVTLIISQKPDLERLRITYNKNVSVSEIKSVFPVGIGSFGIYQRMLTLLPAAMTKVDLLINTHGDLLPYFYTNKCPLITYCHFPTVALSMNEYVSRYRKSLFWKAYFAPYKQITKYLSRPNLVKGTILTNSKFSKNAIKQLYPNIDPTIVYPAADTKSFKRILTSDQRENKVLVLCRFTPEKSIENALRLSQKSGVKISIIGSLISSNRYYYEHLIRMSKSLGVQNLVEFKPNASFNTIIQEMSTSKAYLHTMRGEHFGIAIVEAMSAGLIPIVPDYGGCVEFVPKQYQYSSIDAASDIVQSAFEATFSERKQMSDIADLFSEDAFKRNMRKAIEKTLAEPMKQQSQHGAGQV